MAHPQSHHRSLREELKHDAELVGEKLHLYHRQTRTERILHALQRIGVYTAIFVAGYLVAKMQELYQAFN